MKFLKISALLAITSIITLSSCSSSQSLSRETVVWEADKGTILANNNSEQPSYPTSTKNNQQEEEIVIWDRAQNTVSKTANEVKTVTPREIPQKTIITETITPTVPEMDGYRATIYFKDGAVLNGKVIEKKESNTIEVIMPGGQQSMTYKKSEISRIDPK